MCEMGSQTEAPGGVIADYFHSLGALVRQKDSKNPRVPSIRDLNLTNCPKRTVPAFKFNTKESLDVRVSVLAARLQTQLMPKSTEFFIGFVTLAFGPELNMQLRTAQGQAL